MELLEEAKGIYTKQGRVLDEDKKERMLKLCELSDILAPEFEIEGYDMFMQDGSCSIRFEVGGLEFNNGNSHPFFKLIQNADNMTFAKAKSGNMVVKFIVKDLFAFE